jgi:AcrR family transcriptional regulator
MQHSDFPITDPTPDLAPTARRILEAGIRVLDKHGFEGLTFERIAKESGENGALIRYHFGSKAGLVSTLVDTLLYSEATGLLKLLAPLEPGPERREALAKKRRQVAQDPAAFRHFFDLLPSLLRNPELHPRLRELMQWYRALDAWAIEECGHGGIDSNGLQVLATLSVAVVDGLALQVESDPSFDAGPAFDLWERFVTGYLDGLNGEEG